MHVAGEHTCQLMMKSMVEFIKKRDDITFGNFDVETYHRKKYGKILAESVGNSYSGKSLDFVFYIDIIERPLINNPFALSIGIYQIFNYRENFTFFEFVEFDFRRLC